MTLLCILTQYGTCDEFLPLFKKLTPTLIFILHFTMKESGMIKHEELNTILKSSRRSMVNRYSMNGRDLMRRSVTCMTNQDSDKVLYREILHMCLQIFLNLVQANDLLIPVSD